ncbi:MAG TPA: Fe-S protein assembly co-chaperone HscB [Magnetospirillaceae bacterium]
MANPVETLAVQTCWSCRGPVAARELFCATCGAVQPPGNMDAFARLDLPRDFAVDAPALQRRYFDLQRKLHPDRFAAKSAKERALSQQQAAALNEAYETVKEPLSRAAALLRLAGREVKFDGQHTVADPALLMEAMEMREALAEAETGDEADIVRARAEADVAACRDDLATAFSANDLDDAQRLALRLRYLEKLVDEARLRRRNLA